MDIQAINSNSLNQISSANGESPLQSYYEQFLTMEKNAAEEMGSCTPGSFQYNELEKLVHFASKGAEILKKAMKEHNGVLSHHERHRFEELMNKVNNQCWNIRSHSTSGQEGPLYWSMVNCYWLCHDVLNQK